MPPPHVNEGFAVVRVGPRHRTMAGLLCCSRRAFDENRIAEFVRPISMRVEFTYHLLQGRIVGKGAEQLVMAAARLVGSGKNHVNNPQLGSRTDSLCSQILTRADEPSTAGVLQGAHYCRAYCDDAASVCAGSPDCSGGRLGYAIRLIERQPKVEFSVPSGRDSSGVSESGKANAFGPHIRELLPAESEPGRRWLECHRGACDCSPNVPEGEWCGNVCVLDWAAVARQTGPDSVRRAVEA